MNPVPQSEWKWFGTAGHFVCGLLCRFHLFTQVGEYLVSTVGQYMPPEEVREIIAENRDVVLEGKGEAREADYMRKIGYEDVGYNRKFETMVFKAGPICVAPECGCGIPSNDGYEIEWSGANTAKEATEMHMKLCRKFANKEFQPA